MVSYLVSHKDLSNIKSAVQAYQDRMKAMDDELDACGPETLIGFGLSFS